MEAGKVAPLALAECRGHIAAGMAKLPRKDDIQNCRPLVQQKSAELTADDVLTDEQELELVELKQWAKRLAKAAAARADRLQQSGTPANLQNLQVIQNLCGALIGDAENTYQRAWHARAKGLAKRAA